MEPGAVLRCCVPRPRTAVRRTPFGTASSPRTTAPTCRPDGHSHTRRPGIMPGRLGPFVPKRLRRVEHLRLKGFAMDTVTAFAPRRSDLHATVGVTVAPDPQKALAVAAVYRLSEEGRKA